VYDRGVVRILGIAAIAVVAACGAARPPVGLTVIVDGAGADRARDGVAHRGLDGFVVRAVAPPPIVADPPDPIASILATARAAYQDRGDFAACRAAVDPIDVPSLLAVGKREQAARVLVWRTACAWSGLARADARATAALVGQYGLDLPSDAGAVIPEVEAALLDVIEKAAKIERVPLKVAGNSGGRVVLDGKPTGCTLPCTLDVARGDHVVAIEADGKTPAWRVVRAPAKAAIEIPLARASPAEAGAQWRARIARGLPAIDDTGLELVAHAAGDVRVAYVDADGKRVRGALVVDGAVKARGTRDDGDITGLLGDLTRRGGLVAPTPLVKQPRFWIVLGAGVAAAAAITALVVYEPEIITEVGF
jgi:hypothetical protein